MMGRLQGVSFDEVPECTVAIVSAGDDFPELGALLRDSAEKAAAVVLWCLDDSAEAAATLQRVLADSPVSVRQLNNGDPLRRGVLHLAVGRQRVWFEGQMVRMGALSGPERRPVDEFLSSLAECWGRRTVVVMSPFADGDGERGLGSVRAAGGFGLTLEESRAMAARFNPASSAVLPAQRTFSIRRAMLGVARAAARDAVRNACMLGRLRVWLPGCKTGSMAYALAMLLSDAAAQSEAPLKLQVFGTDPDESALAVARAGRYPARAALDMDPNWRARYTFDEGDTIRISETLREACVFSGHSLSRDPPLSRMDLIVCHRVFDGVGLNQTREIIDALHFSLRGEGLLLPLDHAELFPDDRFELTPEGYLRARPLRAKHLKRPSTPPSAPPSSIDERSLVQGLRRDQALVDAVRARADLERFVLSIGVPILFCDHELRLLDMSTTACQAFGLSDANRNAPLGSILHRLPGGADVARAAARSISEEVAQGLTIRAPQGAYLVHISPVKRLTQPGGVSIAFTNVSELDAAQARAVAQRHQQAAVARVGDLALSVTNETELFEEALGVLFGNISVCVAGVILERTTEDHDLAVLASRGLGDDPLRLLRDMGEPAQMLEAVLERESPVMHPDLDLTGAPRPRAAGAEAATSKPRSAPFHSALTFVKSGMACPIVNEGSVLGVIALYSRQEGLEAVEHQHFVQAVANVLGAAIVRHRTRRRLALELEASSVLASAADTAAAGNGIERALRVALDADDIELWGPDPVAPGQWVRFFPESTETIPLPLALAPFAHAEGSELQPPSYRITTVHGRRQIVVPARRRDHTTALLQLRGRNLRAPDRELCDGLQRIGFMLADFLDRQQIHAALERSEASYRQSSAEFEALYASLPVSVSIHERNGSIRRINGHLARLRDAGEGRASALERLYSEEAPPWIARVLASGEPIQDIELATSSDGDTQSWLCNFAPIRDLDGTILGASAVVQDITALKHVEASLREAAKQKDDFLAILGHELRNPIAAIRNATELLSRIDQSSAQLLRLQSIFDRQTLQTTKLIDGLLDVARVARGKVELQITSVNVVELVRQVIDDRRHQFGSRNVDVRLPDEDLWVGADRVRLVQILDNLLSNALKFTAPTGCVVIDVQRKGRDGHVQVRDDGIGIEPELLPEIFEPFRQGRAATRGGLGLGLALVKGLVDLHGFGLVVQSAGVGQGAAFEIHFPLGAAPAEPAPESRVDMRPLSLLLIEDNADIAETLSELLTDAGHEIHMAGSAEDALVALQAGSPDIILCDIGLPGMDGLTLAEQLRGDPRYRDLKLVAMTGYGDASTRACIERAGFDRYLIKPVQLDALQHCLMRLAAAPAHWISRR